MKISQCALPESMAAFLSSRSLKRKVGSWALKSDYDSYGNTLETELGEVLTTEVAMSAASIRLQKDFMPDGVYGEGPVEDCPGAIPDIVNFDKVVCFGYSSDGAPFCLDYRESEIAPCVIWWDDICWRKISPDFEQFLLLFDWDS